ncbi:MAG: glycosyltransferase family 4 protein [Candidatus Omnitrophica bacterium]|nr:glycosyltransferase family 4 protein [Candidatus Omnitrophota bacterium]
MIILHTETLKHWGGQQNRILKEAIGLIQKGHRVIIVCNRRSILAQKAKGNGIKTYEVRMRERAYLQIPKLIDIIRKENIDIVCTHSSLDSWAGGLAAKLTRRKLVRFRHNLFPIGKNLFAKFIYSIPDRIVAISSSIRDVLIRNGLRGEKISVIPSGVDINIFQPDVEDIRMELNIPSGTLILGNTSTFTKVKGQEFLLTAFNRIYKKFPCILLLAGRVSDKSKYLSYVDKELEDKILFLGHREDIPRVLKTIDIFIFPSINEGLGTALLEAMAMERPVLVSDIPTFREFIIDGVNGLFFKVGNPEDIEEKIYLLIRDRHLRDILGKNARKTISERFSIETMIEKTEQLYKEIY